MKDFHFKQFRIFLHEDVMPLTADAVLFGAWVNSTGRNRILDVGCGNGILSLIQAQRNPLAEVIALDISDKAIQQCALNVQCSPFHRKINVLHKDFFSLETNGQFDLIILNPPFYTTGLPKQNSYIANSRHKFLFETEVFMKKASMLTTAKGVLSVLSTIEEGKEWERRASESTWTLIRKTYTGIDPEFPKRVFLEWEKGIRNSEVKVDFIDLSSEGASGNEKYYDLVADLYIKAKK